VNEYFINLALSSRKIESDMIQFAGLEVEAWLNPPPSDYYFFTHDFPFQEIMNMGDMYVEKKVLKNTRRPGTPLQTELIIKKPKRNRVSAATGRARSLRHGRLRLAGRTEPLGDLRPPG
jgi:hypothetical protein